MKQRQRGMTFLGMVTILVILGAALDEIEDHLWKVPARAALKVMGVVQAGHLVTKARRHPPATGAGAGFGKVPLRRVIS